ncbi:uncharacterized protein RJT21DRAFT_85728 [Scheffersomyces amazonensis]|uniref:uncharacterized protein n=1 Tax=Scheffersomyces amazonensis TaxID=1078765 RepID=UPI00315C5018
MKRTVEDEVKLSKSETKIRDILVEYCNYHNKNLNHNDNDKLELRITGGWVRDKLLGKESHDIDIAVNHLTGEDFASRLLNYLRSHHNELHVKSLHTIKKNPEKSKHLETCTTKLYGVDIDFVNLRSEEYTVDSRVPVIEFGTAEEDALRRDATLNALFYNLNKGEIEDFTGNGLNDLKNGILRTPLPPLQTFLDDPLRVLRLIRFASRFDFIIDPETLEAMKNSDIKVALAYKISRERVDIELEKMFKSDNPSYGLRLINYAGLTESLFGPENFIEKAAKFNDESLIDELENAAHSLKDQSERVTAVFPIFKKIIEEKVSNDSKFKQLFIEVLNNSEYQKPFWLALILFPYRSISLKLSAKKNGTEHAIDIIMREALKGKKSDIDKVVTINKQFVLSRNTLDSYFHDPKSIKRSDLGLYLRNFGTFSDLNIILNAFIEIVQQYTYDESRLYLVPHPIDDNKSNIQTSLEQVMVQTVTKYDNLLFTIQRQELQQVHQLKPLLDGTTLSKEFQRKPGPWIKSVSDHILVWQLDNPEMGKDECIHYVKSIINQYL